jgi:endonuclease/exonuclease/phosphatase family metal-dependent hydrolase
LSTDQERPSAARAGPAPVSAEPAAAPRAGTDAVGEAVELRVLSYNIRSMRDDKQALVRIIRACEPDVVCVQEAPRFFRWRAKCAWLAHETGLVVLTGGRAAGAMLLLGSLRTKVLYTENIELDKLPGLHQRGIALAVLDVLGEHDSVARLCIGSIHLSLAAHERRSQTEAVLHHFEQASTLPEIGTPHIVVAGDINERPMGESWQLLVSRLGDAYLAAPWGGEFTSTARRPYKRIDGIFVSSPIKVISCGVPEQIPGLEDASDHRPVLATLRVPARD